MRITNALLHQLEAIGLDPAIVNGRLHVTHHYAADGDQWSERESVDVDESLERAAEWVREYTAQSA